MSRFPKLPDGFKVKLVCVVLLQILIQGTICSSLTLRTQNVVTMTTTNGPTEQPPTADRCPSTEKISPCSCDKDSLRCVGSSVDQESINRLMTAVRLVNGVAQDQILVTTKLLFIQETSLTSLDITPLFKSHFLEIKINFNYKLSRIHGPFSPSDSSVPGRLKNDGNVNQYFGSIVTVKLSLDYNNLTDAGLADCFHYFNPSLETLDLDGNQIQGPSILHLNKSRDFEQEFTEFLPGISNFINLKYLHLSSNPIQLLEGAPFKSLGSLSYLGFGYRGMGDVGEDAFLMDDNGTNSALERRVEITACRNFSDDNLHVNHGLQLWKGKTTLWLWLNNFEFLSQEKFEPFLQINSENIMDLNDNPLVCDQRMKWLKDGRQFYERRVRSVDCTNDPGHTIFTTNLV